MSIDFNSENITPKPKYESDFNSISIRFPNVFRIEIGLIFGIDFNSGNSATLPPSGMHLCPKQFR